MDSNQTTGSTTGQGMTKTTASLSSISTDGGTMTTVEPIVTESSSREATKGTGTRSSSTITTGLEATDTTMESSTKHSTSFSVNTTVSVSGQNETQPTTMGEQLQTTTQPKINATTTESTSETTETMSKLKTTTTTTTTTTLSTLQPKTTTTTESKLIEETTTSEPKLLPTSLKWTTTTTDASKLKTTQKSLTKVTETRPAGLVSTTEYGSTIRAEVHTSTGSGIQTSVGSTWVMNSTTVTPGSSPVLVAAIGASLGLAAVIAVVVIVVIIYKKRMNRPLPRNDSHDFEEFKGFQEEVRTINRNSMKKKDKNRQSGRKEKNKEITEETQDKPNVPMNYFQPVPTSDEEESKQAEVNQNGGALDANDVKLRDKSGPGVLNPTDRMSMGPVLMLDDDTVNISQFYGTKTFGAKF